MKKLATEGCDSLAFALRDGWVRRVKRVNPSAGNKIPKSKFQKMSFA
jgi:hypothetical protein